MILIFQGYIQVTSTYITQFKYTVVTPKYMLQFRYAAGTPEYTTIRHESILALLTANHMDGPDLFITFSFLAGL